MNSRRDTDTRFWSVHSVDLSWPSTSDYRSGTAAVIRIAVGSGSRLRLAVVPLVYMQQRDILGGQHEPDGGRTAFRREFA